MRSTRTFKTFGFIAIAVAISTPLWAQAQNWWVLPPDGAYEQGRLSEIKTKHRVYVDVVLSRPGLGQITSSTQQADVRKNVVEAFRSHKDLSVVLNPESADFAVVLRTTVSLPGTDGARPSNFSVVLDQDEEVSVELTVLVPGAKLPDGTFRPRSVWQGFSSNVQMGALAGSRFMVDGFLWELKKTREKKQEPQKVLAPAATSPSR